MKIRFKIQPYQTEAVESVVDCFSGQPKISGGAFRFSVPEHSTAQLPLPFTESSRSKPPESPEFSELSALSEFGNAAFALSHEQILANIQSVQHRQNLPVSARLISSAGCKVNLDVEMETGTGKTYCYIKSIFELNKRYGWTKFIIVVPSIAIREGVMKSLEITAGHFSESYGKRARYFAYNSKELHPLESFSSDAGVNVMVINIQAFNATGKDNRRIYEELENFQSRRPIDVIGASRPILILDEPQKMEGGRTLVGLSRFNPLFILRYSATHRTAHNKIHRLDALDAYNRKLVKKISVRGISVQSVGGAQAYLYLESIEVSTRSPIARIEMEVRRKNAVERVFKRLGNGADLVSESNGLEQYRGFVLTQIDADTLTVEFGNGHILRAGDVTGDNREETVRRIQIRESIRAHLARERSLFALGIKTLSLFFIDEVAKYRDYTRTDTCGEYAHIFEQEYEQLKAECLDACHKSGTPGDKAYSRYLAGIGVCDTHSGYFSIDRRTNRLSNPNIASRGKDAGLSDDVEAYTLILRDKERLLSFEEPVRFIFSHSALREGWDNPNVFVMSMLKRSDSTISRRQEVGRGLRISVNQRGERMDDPSTVHEINVLTVVAGESYRDFVGNLQKELFDVLSTRPHKADREYFTGKKIGRGSGMISITPEMAEKIFVYLSANGYVNDAGQICPSYYEAKAKGTLSAFPPDLALWKADISTLIEGVLSDSHMPGASDGRREGSAEQDPGKNVHWESDCSNANMRTIRIDFDSDELIRDSIALLNRELHVSRVGYTVQTGEQQNVIDYEEMKKSGVFTQGEMTTEFHDNPVHFSVAYDLLGEVSTRTRLMRKTIAEILSEIAAAKFSLYKENPEQFIAETSRLINRQKNMLIARNAEINVIEPEEKRSDKRNVIEKFRH